MTLPKSMHVLQKISNLTATQPASLISASYQSKIHKCDTFTYSCKTFAEHFTFTQYQKLLVRIHTSLVVNLETKSSQTNGLTKLQSQWLEALQYPHQFDHCAKTWCVCMKLHHATKVIIKFRKSVAVAVTFPSLQNPAC